MQNALPYIAVLISVFSVLIAIFAQWRTRDERFRNIEKDVTLLKWQVDYFLKDMAKNSAQALHSPHTPILDRLIDKFTNEKLTDEEMDTFKTMLRQIRDDENEPMPRRKVAGETLIMIRAQDRSRMLDDLSRHREKAAANRQKNREGVLGLRHR